LQSVAELLGEFGRTFFGRRHAVRLGFAKPLNARELKEKAAAKNCTSKSRPRTQEDAEPA